MIIEVNTHQNGHNPVSLWQMIMLCDERPEVKDFSGDHDLEVEGNFVVAIDGVDLDELDQMSIKEVEAAAWCSDVCGNCVVYADVVVKDGGDPV